MKVKVYVAWDRKHSTELAEEGKILIDNVETFEFDTQGEADAFCLGINKASGWDKPYWIKDKGARIENGILHEEGF